jgi:hypothetical protein
LSDSVFMAGWATPDPQWSSMSQVGVGCGGGVQADLISRTCSGLYLCVHDMYSACLYQALSVTVT